MTKLDNSNPSDSTQGIQNQFEFVEAWDTQENAEADLPDEFSFGQFNSSQMGSARLTIEFAVDNGLEVASIFAHGKSNFTKRVIDRSEEKILVLKISPQLLEMWPVVIWANQADYLRPKYSNVTKISFPNDGSKKWTVPRSLNDLTDTMLDLPSGFVRAQIHKLGLGLERDYRAIFLSISEFPYIDEIRITEDDLVEISGSIYILGLRRFDALRKAIGGIRRKYRREATEDIKLLTYSNLQSSVDNALYPAQIRQMKPDALFELVKLGAENRTSNDRKAALNVVRAESKELVKTDPAELLKLRTEIELVTLDELIRKFEEMLGKKLKESQWQNFFEVNPFILSLVFAYPIFKLRGHASVGGIRIDGSGEKITDFLFKNIRTGNLALIEIKRPDTTLLYTHKAYRGGLYRPDGELCASVTQVLEQRFQLQTDFISKAYKSNLQNVHPYSIHCIVIAGITPESLDEKKSFELFRNSCKDVFIVTFDETLAKLREIRRVMGEQNSGMNMPETAL